MKTGDPGRLDFEVVQRKFCLTFRARSKDLVEDDTMASSTLPSTKPCSMDRSGSFFKLIDTFALEIGELKQEMVQTSPVAVDADKEPLVLQGLEGEVSGVFLQGSSARGERDSGYDSLRRRMSVLDRLTRTHPAWLLLPLGEDEARRILLPRPAGVFLVRRCPSLQKKVLSVRMRSPASGPPITHYPVRESQYTFSLEGSGISFADLFRLVAFYCISRDILPFTLRLPEAIASAETQKDLEEVALLGTGFWDSALGCQYRSSSPTTTTTRPFSRTLSPERGLRDPARGPATSPSTTRGSDSAPTTLRSSCPRSPSRPSAALCFVNPLFLQAHRRRSSSEEAPPPSEETPPLSDAIGAGHVAPPPASEAAGAVRGKPRARTPPPRPPPPRATSCPRRPPPPPLGKRRSMPETVAVARQPAPPQRHQRPQRPVLRTAAGGSMGGKTAKASPAKASPAKASPPIPVPQHAAPPPPASTETRPGRPPLPPRPGR